MKRILSIILVIVMICGIFSCVDFSAFATGSSYIYGSGTLTRAEWLHNLALAFQMSVEDDNYEDNFFTDLTSDNPYYYDILLNVEFGVIDVEAGEPVFPNETITRGYAASTLNYCLGYRLDTANYTFSDSSACEDPEACQVAVNMGWIQLKSGKFLPNTVLTSTEAKRMIEDAANVVQTQQVDENYNNQWDLASGIKEVPQGTEVTIEGNTLKIAKCPISIKTGDKFVVYNEDIPVAYQADSINVSGSITTIQVTALSAGDAFDDYDAQGIVDGDAFSIEPNNNLSENEEVTVEDIDLPETGTSQTSSGSSINSLAAKSTAKENIKNISAKKINYSYKVGDGFKVGLSLTMTNTYAKYQFSKSKVYIQIVSDVKTSVSLNFSSEKGLSKNGITLAGASIPGIGEVAIKAGLAISSGLSSTTSARVSYGIEYTKARGMRYIKDFSCLSFSVVAKASADIFVEFSAGIKNTFATARVYARAGAIGEIVTEKFDNGTPRKCTTFHAWFYARYGTEGKVSVAGIQIFNYEKTIHIFQESNSPVKVWHHYEDGREVRSCARGIDYVNKYYTKWNSRHWSSGWYDGMGAYGLDGEGAQIPIFEYTTDSEGNATITKYNGCSNYVYIPETLDEHKVVAIGSNVFKGHSEILGISIPEGIVSIGANAFNGCSGISALDLPKTLTTLGTSAFLNCTSLYELFIPKNLKSVGTTSTISLANAWDPAGQHGPFSGCSSLRKVSFENGISNVPNALLTNTGIQSISLPSTVTSTSEYALAYCYSLQKVVLPNALTDIAFSTFCGDIALTDIVLPPNLKHLGSYAFLNCRSLQSINIPKTLTNVDYYDGWTAMPWSPSAPFEGCISLKTINFEKGVSTIPQYLFAESELETITIPEGVTTIQQAAFFNCDKLATVTFPSSLTSIGVYAFRSCEALKSIRLPDALKTLNANAFAGCTQLTSLYIPKTITDVDLYDGYTSNNAYPFSGCSALKKIDFAQGILTIPNYILGYTGVESIDIPNTVTTIEKNSFYNCSKLSKITIPDSVKSIGDGAFAATAITNITVPDSVTGMGSSVFSGCQKLASVKLPSSRVNITENMFYNCTSLKSIDLPKTVENINAKAFYGSGITEIKLPDNVKLIGEESFSNSQIEKVTFGKAFFKMSKKAFANCDKLTTFKVPVTIESIGQSVFEDCDNLKTVEFEEGSFCVGRYMFSSCDSLENVKLAHSIYTVYENAFKECPLLKEIFIPINTNTIDNSAFTYYNNLTVKGVSGSKAEEFALAHKDEGTVFVPLNRTAQQLKVTQKDITVKVDEKAQLTYEVIPSDFTDLVTWKVPDTYSGIVTVNRYGTITGKKAGNAQVVLYIGDDLYETYNITVLQPVDIIQFASYSVSLNAFESYDLKPSLYPDNAYDKSLKWDNSNPSVASVNESGVITALSNGQTKIKATAVFGGAYRECTVTVNGNGYIVEKTDAFQSAHNYSNNMSDVWKYQANGAERLTIHFNHNTKVEQGCDYIYIFDKDFKEIGKYTGSELGGKAIEVEGDTVHVKLVSDGAGTAWGFKVDSVTVNTEHIHTIVEDEAVAPTCTESGKTAGKHCSICGAVLQKQEEVPALGHRFEDTIYEPTCQNTGCTVHVCLVCGASLTDSVVPKKEHNTIEIKENEVAATCTQEGSYESIILCVDCGEKLFKGIETIPKAPHSFKNTKVVKPTTVKAGYNNQKCTVCGAKGRVCIGPTGKVSGMKCKSRTTSAQKISWKAIKGAQGYQIQISTVDGTEWGKIYNAKKTTNYTFKKLSAGGNYRFRVRIYAKGIDGSICYGSWTKAFSSPTLPTGTTLTKFSPAKKAFTAQWKKNAAVNGYQVQYSLKSNFAGAKTITVKNPKLLKATASKLYAGKYYYVRIRTYKTISKTNYFSAWSKTYKVKTK